MDITTIPEFVSVKWLHRNLGGSIPTWHRRLKRGEIPFKTHGNKRVVARGDLAAYLASRNFTVAEIPEGGVRAED